jgi:hypothetical protein
MSSGTVISVSHLSKAYRLGTITSRRGLLPLTTGWKRAIFGP